MASSLRPRQEREPWLNDKDKEDVLQYLSAQSVDANYIISRDKKGFINSPIEVLSPQEFLSSSRI